MRSGILLILVVLLASIVCSQEARFVYPVPAPTEFTQRNLVYKQAGQTGLSLDLFLTTHSAGSKPLPVLVIFNGFGGEFMRTSAQAQGWAKAATAHGFAAITAETTAEHVAEDGPTVFAHACRLGAEGIVSKKVDGTYRSGPCPVWIEVRNPASIAVQRERSERWNR